MKRIKLILSILILLVAVNVKSGDPICWVTYGQSKFVASPGFEAGYFFNPYLGINLGVGFYIQNPDFLQLTSIIHEASGGFYSGNIGYSGYLYQSEIHSIGIITGFKFYYGPDYRKLRYYEEGSYYIYYDSASLKMDYGLDMGVFYTHKKISLLAKWDFARNRFRIGLGYVFN